MAFEFVEGHYYIGFWYFDIPAVTKEFGVMGPFGKGGNYNMLVWRTGDDGGGRSVDWTVQYRFRYYRDERIHDNQDQFDWYAGVVSAATIQEIERASDRIVTAQAMMIGQIYDCWPIRGDCFEFSRRAQNSPPYWMHLDPRGAMPTSKP